MTEPGWHPDPFGRAGRRYHDGSAWTEHVADDQGHQSTDPPPVAAPEADPSATAPGTGTGILIGAPPPRRRGGPVAPDPPDEPDDAAPTQAVPRAARPALDKAAPPAAAPDPAPAPPRPAEAVPAPAPPAADQATTVIPAEVAAAVAASAAHTGPIPPGPVPAGEGADQTTVIPVLRDDTGAGPAAGAAPPGHVGAPAPPAKPGGLNVLGLALALLGILLALVGLFVVGWDDAASDTSYLGLRKVVDENGPPIGAVPTSLLLSGGLFTLVAGGLVAFARAVGSRVLSVLAFMIVLLAFLGLSALGVLAVDVDPGDLGLPSTETSTSDQAPGSPVTDPATGAPPTVAGGAPVTDPVTGAAPTVPDQGQGADDVADEAAALADDAAEAGERNLIGGAIVGFALMFVATVASGVGLLRRRRGTRVMALLGLGVLAGWCIVGTVMLGGDDGVPRLGKGPWVLSVGAVLLAVSTVVPRLGRRAAE